jgi:hypothetical protein
MTSLVPYRANDPYADEPTAELDPALYLRWKAAKDNADGWLPA